MRHRRPCAGLAGRASAGGEEHEQRRRSPYVREWEPRRHGVAARLRARRVPAACSAYARSALPSRKSQRARLDSKRRFTSGAAFVGNEA